MYAIFETGGKQYTAKVGDVLYIEKLNAENKRLQQQSAMVKKNTEYQAMLGTIALNEKKVGDLESRELELMDRFEEARKAYRKIRQDNEAAVNAIRAEFDELVAFAGDLKKEIAQLKEERPADIRGVDGEPGHSRLPNSIRSSSR